MLRNLMFPYGLETLLIDITCLNTMRNLSLISSINNPRCQSRWCKPHRCNCHCDNSHCCHWLALLPSIEHPLSAEILLDYLLHCYFLLIIEMNQVEGEYNASGACLLSLLFSLRIPSGINPEAQGIKAAFCFLVSHVWSEALTWSETRRFLYEELAALRFAALSQLARQWALSESCRTQVSDEAGEEGSIVVAFYIHCWLYCDAEQCQAMEGMNLES